MTAEKLDPPHQAYAVRQGLLILTRPFDRPMDEKLLGALCDSLRGDSRIHDFERPPFRKHATRSDTFYPPIGKGSGDAALVGADHFHSVHFSDPVVFRLAVAPENQETFQGKRDFPEGSYYVAWNGVTVTVLWEQDPTEDISTAAGRIVFDVLREAAERAGMNTFNQACNPGCRNRFTHTNAYLMQEDDPRKAVERAGRLTFRRPPEHWFDNPLEAVRDYERRIAYPFFLFALYKNQARRIRDLVDLSGSRLQAMLKLQQRHAAALNAPRRRRIQALWAMRGWRRRSKKLTADLWLAVAAIEVYQKAWNEKKRRFDRTAKRSGLSSLFKTDSSDDAAAIAQFNPSLTREALDSFASRLDSRAIAMVTALAGLAGLLGALLGAALAS